MEINGHFFVEPGCCTLCGVPQMIAPNLVGITDESLQQCYWKKQPETEAELEQVFAIFDAQELGCHKYDGNDPEILKRVGDNAENFPRFESTNRPVIKVPRWPSS